jgi:DNA-binding PadR family transcriptional regulator
MPGDDRPPPRQEAFRTVRPKDHAVLAFVARGADTTAAINDASPDETLARGDIRYAFEKLEQDGLLAVEWDRDGTETRVVDGVEKTHPTSNRAALTDRGRRYLAQTDRDGVPTRFDITAWKELEDRVDDLEDTVRWLVRRERERQQ